LINTELGKLFNLNQYYIYKFLRGGYMSHEDKECCHGNNKSHEDKECCHGKNHEDKQNCEKKQRCCHRRRQAMHLRINQSNSY
jgi:hypothetical protein